MLRSTPLASCTGPVNLVTYPLISHKWGKDREVVRQVEHTRGNLRHRYSITVNQVMVTIVTLSEWWCDLYCIPATQRSLIPYILRTYLISISHQQRYFVLFLESLICIAVIVRISHSGEGWKETRHFLNLWLVMTTMEKNSLAYSQIILLVALVSICAFLSSKSHHMHCWIPVMCHRAQTHSADPRISGSRKPLNERVVNTERGPLWLTWFYIPVEDLRSVDFLKIF